MGLKKDCLFELKTFITDNKSLESLILNCCKFPAVDNVPTKCVPCGLKNNALHFLYLCSCFVGKGGDFLVRWVMSLVPNSPLKHLSLPYCMLNDSQMQ